MGLLELNKIINKYYMPPLCGGKFYNNPFRAKDGDHNAW
jgi:hypothetical protein